MGLHICMIAPEFAPGGIGNYIYNLSKKLMEKEHKITVLTRGSVKKTYEKVIDGIQVYNISILPLYPFHVYIHGFFVNSLFKSLEPKFNIVHFHTPLAPFVKTNLPTLSTVHSLYNISTKKSGINDFNSLNERLQSIFLNSLDLKTLKHSNKITTVSQINAKYLDQYGFNKNNIKVIGNGVDETFYSPKENINNENKYILYVGRFIYGKGLFTILQCAEYIFKEYPNIKLLLAGEGPMRNQLEKKVREMGLQRKILFLGYVTKERLLQLYRNAYILLIASMTEGLPNVLLEAMSSGLPVIATNVGGNPEVISSGKNGFLVSPQSPLKMAKIVVKLLNDVKFRNKIGKNARETIEKYYTWNKISDKILQCYYDIL